MDFMGGELC